MPTEKDQTTSEVASLRAENEKLRAQLAQATVRTANVPAARPYLTEGERQELITFGVAGRLNLSTAAREFPEVDLSDATEEAKSASAEDEVAVKPASIRGFDYVYPSVAPGKIDPAVAGLPGISGPAA